MAVFIQLLLRKSFHFRLNPLLFLIFRTGDIVFDRVTRPLHVEIRYLFLNKIISLATDKK